MNSETCPVDGCERTFERETEEKARSSVISHVSGSTDEAHSGIGYQKAKKLLDLHGGASAEPSTEPGRSAGTETEVSSSPADEPSSTEPSTEPSSQSEAGTRADGGNPALGGPDPDPDAGAAGGERETEDDDAPGCPHCGTPIAGWGELEAGRYRCGDCGDPFAKEGAAV